MASYNTTDQAALPYYQDWPQTHSIIAPDPTIEAEVQRLLSLMTLEEKIGQMIQPEIFSVTPEEAKQYKLGSILNGAGGWPNEDKHCSVTTWATTIDQYWQAVRDAFEDRPFTIPLLWGTDAVHGHNNVYGATVFPHNIGLGATNDPELIERIGRATAKEIAATGIDWTFAPTVTTPRDIRWGRHYEGYSEDPELVERYARSMVKGLQGSTTNNLRSEQYILSNVKHWLGDGGTQQGIDRGVNGYTESELLNIHSHGYISALNAGAQIVMVSFNSWQNDANYGLSLTNLALPLANSTQPLTYNYKVHGSHYLNTVVLKKKLGFDGIVITDWDGHAEVTGSSFTNANYSVRSGVDIVMVASGSENWQTVYQNLIKGVQQGEIPQERIDDAVRRILRVKMRAGLWEKGKPSNRFYAKKPDIVGCTEHTLLAREAVRKSLVLLKNQHGILPLSRQQPLLVTGSAVNDITKQTGGWTLSWQATDNHLDDFPNADTLLGALTNEMGADKLTYDPDLSRLEEHTNQHGAEEKTALVVIGEDAYAEMRGDIKPWRPAIFSLLKPSYKMDLERIQTLKNAGFKVITLFYSGRPLGVNQELSLSDAFVAAWLPGTQALGITDVILRDKHGHIHHDFQGKLAYSWPAYPFSYAINRPLLHMPKHAIPEQEQQAGGNDTPLFPYGYGMTYHTAAEEHLPLNQLDLTYHDQRPTLPPATRSLLLMDGKHTYDYEPRITGRSSWSGEPLVTIDEDRIQTGGRGCLKNDSEKGHVFEIEYFGYDFYFHLQPVDCLAENLSGYLSAEACLTMTLKVIRPPEDAIFLANHNEYPNQPALDISDQLRACPINTWSEVTVPLNALADIGCDFKSVSSPFMLYGETKMLIQIASVAWQI
ncbi:glycoside hydrolase family 3 protein [Marinomonas agarivorans]|nr:glycoside hydrolase family 3 protein [Marinomonas agarivorans]